MARAIKPFTCTQNNEIMPFVSGPRRAGIGDPFYPQLDDANLDHPLSTVKAHGAISSEQCSLKLRLANTALIAGSQHRQHQK